MPTMPNINLDVRNFSSSAPGWHDVQASNGQTYSYCFTGGSDGAGGLNLQTGQGTGTAPLQLVAAPRYQIADCTFTGDIHHQLSWRGSGNRAGTITDQNDAREEAAYIIQVTDTDNGNCTIECHPPIINN